MPVIHALPRIAGTIAGRPPTIVSVVTVRVDGRTVAISPVTTQAAPIVLGEELRDLGAAVAARALRSIGATLVLDGETLRVELPE